MLHAGPPPAVVRTPMEWQNQLAATTPHGKTESLTLRTGGLDVSRATSVQSLVASVGRSPPPRQRNAVYFVARLKSELYLLVADAMRLQCKPAGTV